MFSRSIPHDILARLQAFDSSFAVIEFALDGTILTANANFLKTMGYGLDEIQGRHHRIFVEPNEAASGAYAAFWSGLRRGEPQAGEFLRRNKKGAPIWLEAIYKPLLDPKGHPKGVIKFATDITAKTIASNRLISMIDRMPVAVMTADPENDFRINYLNTTSRTTLAPIEQHLPIKIADMLGTSFDVFHQTLKYQRSMLADPSRLPHRTRIRLGSEVLELQVSAITGPDDSYIGPMLTWSIVTGQVQMASEVSQVVEIVNAAAQEMRDSAEGLTRSAGGARERAASVAAGSEQMTRAIQEISERVGRVSERAQQIAAQAGTTDATMRTLSENAGQVENLVGMIKSIADQTNLLALNATIE
ncbi:methyl-accepting chemotaxis protein, partial [Methylobacterium soli]